MQERPTTGRLRTPAAFPNCTAASAAKAPPTTALPNSDQQEPLHKLNNNPAQPVRENRNFFGPAELTTCLRRPKQPLKLQTINSFTMSGLMAGDSFPEGVSFVYVAPTGDLDVTACGIGIKYNASEGE